MENTSVNQQTNTKTPVFMIATIAVIVGLVLGVMGGKFLGMSKSTSEEMTSQKQAMTAKQMPLTDTKAADLRVLLNALEREHVDLASTAVRNGFDGNPDFKASADQLDQNSQALAATVGSVYGKDAESKFLTIWRSHIGYFVDYTVAAKKGDKAGMEKAVTNLGGYVEEISDFFSSANPNLPRQAVHDLVNEHVMLLKSAVDTYGAGDYAGSYMHQHEANEQIGEIADALSGAIVKQHPETFN